MSDSQLRHTLTAKRSPDFGAPSPDVCVVRSARSTSWREEASALLFGTLGARRCFLGIYDKTARTW